MRKQQASIKSESALVQIEQKQKGLAQAFFARSDALELAAPEVLARGLSTALFTTIGGLIVFLFGQAFLILWREWEAFCERGVEPLAREA